MAEVVKSEFIRFCKFLGSMVFVVVMVFAMLLIFTVVMATHWGVALFLLFVWLYIFERAE